MRAWTKETPWQIASRFPRSMSSMKCLQSPVLTRSNEFGRTLGQKCHIAGTTARLMPGKTTKVRWTSSTCSSKRLGRRRQAQSISTLALTSIVTRWISLPRRSTCLSQIGLKKHWQAGSPPYWEDKVWTRVNNQTNSCPAVCSNCTNQAWYRMIQTHKSYHLRLRFQGTINSSQNERCHTTSFLFSPIKAWQMTMLPRKMWKRKIKSTWTERRLRRYLSPALW